MTLFIANHLFRRLNYSYKLFIGMNSIIDNRYKSLLIRTNLNIELKTSPTRYYSTENSRWATIIFEKPDGTQIKRKGKVGDKIQEVVGINDPDFCGYGACDGTLSCSTCHVILSNEDIKKYGEADGEEADLLDYAPSATNNSRLGCNIEIVPEMDGIILKLPDTVNDLRD